MFAFVSGPHPGAFSDTTLPRHCRPALRPDMTILADLAYMSVPNCLTPIKADHVLSVDEEEFNRIVQFYRVRMDDSFDLLFQDPFAADMLPPAEPRGPGARSRDAILERLGASSRPVAASKPKPQPMNVDVEIIDLADSDGEDELRNEPANRARGGDQSIKPAFRAGSNEPIGKNFNFFNQKNRCL